jgi:hypothetical protein
MTVEWKEDKVEKISKMGFYELMDYKEDIIASQVENPTKFFLYDIIDERLRALDAEGATVICDDSSFETMEWSER